MIDYHVLYYYLLNESKECKMHKKNETRKMNKEIEEMMLTVPQKIVAYDGNPAGQHLYGEQRQEIAEALYNAGYRKIDENCAVITKAELKEYKRQAVKTFAEQLKKGTRINNHGLEFVALVDIDAELKALLKEYEQ